MQKVRCNFLKLQQIDGIKFQVLITFNYELKVVNSQILFHLSLTVLVHYRLLKLYLDFEGGPPIFKQHITCVVLLFYKRYFLTYRAYTFSS